MNYTKQVVKAIELAQKSYGNIKQNNLPAIFLAYYRASKLDCEECVCVAILNVGLELKKLQLNHLKKDFPFPVTDALFILTKDDTLSYPDYIRRIKTNPIATKVKIVELEHKIELLQLEKNKQHLKQQKEKYEFALKILK